MFYVSSSFTLHRPTWDHYHYSSTCERQCKANVTKTKYFCCFISVTRSKEGSFGLTTHGLNICFLH